MEVKEYYYSGKIKSTGFIVNGIKDGKWIYFFENGNIELVQNFSQGILNGLRTEYYLDGQIKEVEEWKDDQCTPIAFWDENGIQLMKDGTGKKILHFGPADILICEHYFENGKFIKEVKIQNVTYMGFFPKEKF